MEFTWKPYEDTFIITDNGGGVHCGNLWEADLIREVEMLRDELRIARDRIADLERKEG